MFGFDGEYRRRPQQSLGGASQTCDRDTVIRKAQQERQRRNEQRRRNNGAIVLQSYTRSYICRQRQKNLEREFFDDYMHTHRDKLTTDENLTYLLRRIIFFYNSKEPKDAERMIDLSQHILRNPGRFFANSATEHIWLHRLKRLLDICIVQLSAPQASQAIPLRMLETFTSVPSVERHVEDEQMVLAYMQRIFSYLIERKYFARLRCLLEAKCPPLDGDILHPPNPFAEALYQLMLRPLLQPQYSNRDCTLIFQSFAQHILAPAYTDAVRHFIIPCLAQNEQFPFAQLINTLQQLLPTSLEQLETNEKLKQKQMFGSFLLNSLLKLDGQHLGTLHSKSLLGDYIRIIAEVSPRFLMLPRSALKLAELHRRSERMQAEYEDSSDDDDDDEDDDDNEDNNRKSEYIEQAIGTQSSVSRANAGTTLSLQEKEVLLECVDQLNHSQRVHTIVMHMSEYAKDAQVLYALCEICHNLMIFNKMAIFEYK